MQDARAEAATPIFRAPVGAAASKLEEVPANLRKPARAAVTGPARSDTVAAEFTARRTSREERAIDDEFEEQRVVIDEQAFSVQSPGGGVLAHQRETAAHRPEPPAVLRGR